MKRKIIDAHFHNSLWFSEGKTFVDFQKEYRKKCGVTGLSILCVPTTAGQTGVFCPAQNILGAISKLEDDKDTVYAYGGLFYPEAPINPEHLSDYDFKKQAERLMEIGFDGMKMLETKPTIHKKYAYSVDSKGYEEYFCYLEENEIPLVMHVNDPHDFWDPEKAPVLAHQNGWFYGDGTFASKEQIYQEVYHVLDRHPKLKVNLPHGFFMGDQIEELTALFEKYENVYTDIAPGPAFLEAISRDYGEWRAFFEKYYKRILFGTDAKNYSPFWLAEKLFEELYRFLTTTDEYVGFEYYDSACTLHGLGLDEEKLDCIFYKNYMDIVGGKPKKIDRAAFKRYIEEFMPNLVEGDTKEQILKYYKEKF